MLSKSDITLTTSSTLTINKDQTLEERGGIFLFGFRLVTESGAVFEDPTVVEGIFTTEQYSWNSDTNIYDAKTTQYYDADCQTVFQENVQTDPSYEYTSLSSSAIERVHYETFRCPRDLTKNFIDGALGDAQYTKTFLRVYACDGS
eukprot:CAMPEP_0185572166 /NCGR_PEP_ID=MMETSP0434-20130131/4123_1 /TAXON_ID=626734 ORGANISM="Favella taraikaensis, Strain Fe Narragansett Bay" /NCGR_SAMPLE_ID=MMETSP0434 /ASSEMBLY_ACC=CAM_ASM_000379 /LENGTH=145 /DNA_ID=CAMNT_0028187907 /DNA_START=198 /DNA_END=635 /DNA_ORIENTATION=+